jgi:LytTr DNA-binding domain
MATPTDDRDALDLHRLNALVWALLALAVAGQETALHFLTRSPAPLSGELLAKLTILPCWALVTPRAIASVARWPLHGPRAWRHAARHLGFAVLFVLGSNVVIRIPQFLGPGGFALGAFGRSLLQGLTLYGPLALVVYGTIVSVGEWMVLRGTGDAAPRQASLPSAASFRTYAEALSLREGETLRLVPVREIEHIEADDNYIRIWAAAGAVHRVRGRLGDIQAQLDPSRFLRIHRSAIVPLDRVRAVVPVSHGDWAVELDSGVRLRVARGRRRDLQAAIAARSPAPAS